MMSRMTNTLRVLAAVAALAAAGCDSTGPCTLELQERFIPAEPTISVGQTIEPVFELIGCGGRERWRPGVVWRTTDTALVIVDSIRGRITGKAVGDAVVTAVEVLETVEIPHPYPVKVR
jgi:hypothetical protein